MHRRRPRTRRASECERNAPDRLHQQTSARSLAVRAIAWAATRSVCRVTGPTSSASRAGNWASAMSDCLGMAGGGLVPTDWLGGGGADAAAAAADASHGFQHHPCAGGMGGMGAMPMAGLGQGDLGRQQVVGATELGGSVRPDGAAPAPRSRRCGWTARRAAGGDGGHGARHARNGLCRTQLRRLRRTALRRQAGRHAEGVRLAIGRQPGRN